MVSHRILEEKRDVINLCSKRATRRILRYHWYWDISEPTVGEIKSFFNRVLNLLAEGIIKEHLSQNDNLVKYNLKPKLRLSIHKKFLDEVLKRIVDISMGATGEKNSNTVVSKKQENEVT